MENQRTKENPLIMGNLNTTRTQKSELFEELMKYRVKKCETIIRLHRTFQQPVITLRVNYPGMNKSNAITRSVIAEVAEAFEAIMKNKVVKKEPCETPEGPTIFYVVKGDAPTLKENTIYLEQHHDLGRFADIDVFDVDEEYPISRMELSYEPRTCFLCKEPASVCTREKRHTQEELIAFIEEHVTGYLEKKIQP
ncbi:citrate lyase holo-[acyl-carrier protein] synthase [Proteiniclasticum sp. BAD-10]|uniref:citrate lyase holo-[acyl-carrier protein] synthase n=1 Tax=Proteiniclasticum sediminis TaxID=2804028 RepID=A0A941CRV2_9CLOT|nr:citrate lyase holo-[acyl-carrier protein] synthase [Proteiniclasticum sediminis]MBR0576969.1 citrate lyase holo-[acyl-carrier protein] synthase [Proteiniclasticum sediminis]